MKSFISPPSLVAAIVIGSLSASTLAEPIRVAYAKQQGRPAKDWNLQWPADNAPWSAPLADPIMSPAPPVIAKKKAPSKRRALKVQSGKASFYANRFHGRRTASGHLYYKDAYTAAHRTLPLGTWVKVTNTRNQLAVVVQITDRGPFAGTNRIIDLSRRAATEIDMLESGVVPVRVEVVQDFEKPDDNMQVATL